MRRKGGRTGKENTMTAVKVQMDMGDEGIAGKRDAAHCQEFGIAPPGWVEFALA